MRQDLNESEIIRRFQMRRRLALYLTGSRPRGRHPFPKVASTLSSATSGVHVLPLDTLDLQ